jgi:hypothetical protein
MKPEDYSERTTEIEGWRVHVVSYRLGEKYISTADNVSPGANLARREGATREEAEAKVLERARELLARTRRQAV